VWQRECCRHRDDLAACEGKQAIQLGKTQVVTDAQAEASAQHIDRDDLVACVFS